jgi:ABC-type Fe3+-hydroxamate transport system substrate-binding protein
MAPVADGETAVRRVPCELLGTRIDVPEKPQRIVSLLSAATETLFALGAGDRVVGVSKYCGRYVDISRAKVVGEYLRVDEELLRELKPDLVIFTSGVQLGVARKLLKQGYPVMALPLPNTFPGMVDVVRHVAALAGETARGLVLAHAMEDEAVRLRAVARMQACRPRVFVDLWFGRHERTVGGLTFVHDLVDLAGADTLFGNRDTGYFVPDNTEVLAAKPDAILLFSEDDDHPVDVPKLVRERGWEGIPLILSDITRGRIVIHDGPSFLESARWLAGELARIGLVG